ncbi:SanA/YdcF family protein [Gordonia sp. CPCC 205333]|uniref:SanA/YdcF family protein n=1 Tax=Gordonia sp. CPCC 205333 TaxID=3140790 RepID=UPI003AF35931
MSSSRLTTRVTMALFIGVELVMTVALTWVGAAASGRTYDPAQLPPPPHTALVLGSLVSDGWPGDYVRGRLDTTVELWNRGDLQRIILSGNGSAAAGNEPLVMRGYLVARGVRADVIVDDPEGFDTAASCHRARTVYDATAVLIVTQDFHLDRAIALCRAADVDAIGVEARCDCPVWTLIRNHVREPVLANPRALLSALAS